jgi:hypothetical protein
MRVAVKSIALLLNNTTDSQLFVLVVRILLQIGSVGSSTIESHDGHYCSRGLTPMPNEVAMSTSDQPDSAALRWDVIANTAG